MARITIDANVILYDHLNPLFIQLSAMMTVDIVAHAHLLTPAPVMLVGVEVTAVQVS